MPESIAPYTLPAGLFTIDTAQHTYQRRHSKRATYSRYFNSQAAASDDEGSVGDDDHDSDDDAGICWCNLDECMCHVPTSQLGESTQIDSRDDPSPRDDSVMAHRTGAATAFAHDVEQSDGDHNLGEDGSSDDSKGYIGARTYNLSEEMVQDSIAVDRGASEVAGEVSTEASADTEGVAMAGAATVALDADEDSDNDFIAPTPRTKAAATALAHAGATSEAQTAPPPTRTVTLTGTPAPSCCNLHTSTPLTHSVG